MNTYVAITMRTQSLDSPMEIRDCLDERWWHFLECCGITPICLPNSIALANALLEEMPISGLILTGGGDIFPIAKEYSLRENIEETAIKYMVNHNLPILGVCRGMQKICAYFGGTLKKISNHVNVMHKIVTETNREVNSFHQYGIDFLPKSFYVSARSEDGEVESIQCREGKIVGIMWHPEREAIFSKEDVGLFKNFFIVKGGIQCTA